MSDIDQSVESDDTSVVETSESQTESDGVQAQEGAEENKQDEKIGFNDPRHPDHTRFKELLDGQREYKQKFEEVERERVSYKQSIEAMQRELQALRQQATPKEQPKVDPFLADLEKVNPAYAKSLQSVYERAAKAEEVEKRLQQYETQQFQEKAYSKFSNLLTDNKVSDPMDQRVYKAAIRETIMDMENSTGKRATLNDLENVFSNFHKEYSKVTEERNRKLTASYVKEKTKDTTPKGTTGGAATSPTTKKLAADDYAGQAKWLADQIRVMKKQI